MKTVHRPQQMKTFIQQTLGCGCPEPVFDSMLTDIITIAAWPSLPITRLLIGQRLLVYCVRLDQASGALLSALAVHGRRERDENGYNRVRLVIFSTQPDHDGPMLMTLFPAIQGDDERIYLHVMSINEPTAVAAGLITRLS